MPCTTNTAAKLAGGISDTSVTLIANTIRGKKIPIMVMCVAHEDLIKSPPVQESLNKLRNEGIIVLDPNIEEGKAKVPEIEDIVFSVFYQLETKLMKDKHVIITAGPTREFIDEVRFISNPSSGKSGIELAKVAHFQGADVDLILGPTNEKPPNGISVHHVISSEEMTDKTLEIIGNHPNSVIILSSAMSDFTMGKQEGKIKSGDSLQIDLKPTTKLSSQIKSKFPKSTLILYKAEAGLSKEDLVKSAQVKLQKDNADLIIANDISNSSYGFSSNHNKILMIDKTGIINELTDTKSNIALEIISQVSKQI
jgi:phosphopantothenoylcysteine decarboxylase/phosphopantothenate--cysteine ligase